MENIEDAIRKRVALFLPSALDAALRSYEIFVAAEGESCEPDETEAGGGGARKAPRSREKIFAEHHGACKAALAHVEILIRLSAFAQSDHEDEDAERRYAEALEQANDYLRREAESPNENDYQ